MKKANFTKIFLWFSIAIFLFGSGYKLGESKAYQQTFGKSSYRIINKNQDGAKSQNIDFSLFWDTWNTLEEKFIDRDKLDPRKMFYGALKGLAASPGDAYTFFLTPEENKQSKDDLGGKFEGIGAQLGLKNNQIIVIAPLKDSPAQRAGIKAGDVIVKVNGESTKNWTLPQAVSKIRGEKGTKVKLTLKRNNKEFTLDITRDQIRVISVELAIDQQQDCKTTCPKVAHIKLSQFGENTNEEWDKTVEEVQKQWAQKSIQGLVVDLRDNPGGFLESSVYVASEFLSPPKLVVKQESTSTENKDYTVRRDGKLLDIPLVVLVNKGSASASEILAGALQDYKRAVLVGEKSFGKGSVQEAIDLKDGSGLHVTVAKWILPSGRWINGKGVTPEIVVENKITDGNTLMRENDVQLEKAIEQVLK